MPIVWMDNALSHDQMDTISRYQSSFMSTVLFRASAGRERLRP